MAVREALLALLVDGPKHGYQLKHDFEAATGTAWPLNVGQVYTTLQRLERDELVTPTADEPGPDQPGGRVPYALTERGRAEAEVWLGTPSPAALAGRDETSMRLLIALATRAAPIGPVIADQRRTATETLQTLTAMRVEPDQSLAWRIQLDRMLFLAEAEIRWLDRVEERLTPNDTSDTAGGDAHGGASTEATGEPGSAGATDDLGPEVASDQSERSAR